MDEKYICVGLFGSCAKTTFRQDLFIPRFKLDGVKYYNPQVGGEWKPSMAEEEAQHLANDRIVTFPLTNDSYSLGSLSEIGFSVLNAIRLDDRRYFVVMIDQFLAPNLLEGDNSMAEESLKSRALVKQHLIKLNYSNIFVVDDLHEMLSVSLQLYKNVQIEYNIRKKL